MDHKQPKSSHSESDTGTRLALKLLVDREGNRVIYAEAGKDVVDFLFSLLRMPVASIIRLLTSDKTAVGCMGNIFESVGGLDDVYIQSSNVKDMLLKPRIVPQLALQQHANLLILEDTTPKSPTTPVKFYTCPSPSVGRASPFESTASPSVGFPPFASSASPSVGFSLSASPSFGYSASSYASFASGISASTSTAGRCSYYTETLGTLCPQCNCKMTVELKPLQPQRAANEIKADQEAAKGEGLGFVKGQVTYMVMDDLTVSTLSTISALTLLKKLGLNDVGTLEEQHVSMGMNEGLALLNASFKSNTVLTDVFLTKNKNRD